MLGSLCAQGPTKGSGRSSREEQCCGWCSGTSERELGAALGLGTPSVPHLYQGTEQGVLVPSLSQRWEPGAVGFLAEVFWVSAEEQVELRGLSAQLPWRRKEMQLHRINVETRMFESEN